MSSIFIDGRVESEWGEASQLTKASTRTGFSAGAAKPAGYAKRYMPESTKSSAAIISERYDDKSYAWAPSWLRSTPVIS